MVVLAFLVSIFAISCNSGSKTDLSADSIENPNSASGVAKKGSLPAFEFVKTEHDFGKIIDGVRVSFKYKFNNVGGSPLVVSFVKTSCGCTVSNWTKEPVEPGKSGFIELSFDSSHRKGPNHKMATVMANTQPNTLTLSFTAEVVDAEDL
jgi:hypothetical protein